MTIRFPRRDSSSVNRAAHDPSPVNEPAVAVAIGIRDERPASFLESDHVAALIVSEMERAALVKVRAELRAQGGDGHHDGPTA